MNFLLRVVSSLILSFFPQWKSFNEEREESEDTIDWSKHMQEIGYREYSQCEKHKSLKSPFLGAYNSRWSVKMTVILIVIDRGEGDSRNPSDERELRLIQNHGDVFSLTDMKIPHRWIRQSLWRGCSRKVPRKQVGMQRQKQRPDILWVKMWVFLKFSHLPLPQDRWWKVLEALYWSGRNWSQEQLLSWATGWLDWIKGRSEFGHRSGKVCK